MPRSRSLKALVNQQLQMNAQNPVQDFLGGEMSRKDESTSTSGLGPVGVAAQGVAKKEAKKKVGQWAASGAGKTGVKAGIKKIATTILKAL